MKYLARFTKNGTTVNEEHSLLPLLSLLSLCRQSDFSITEEQVDAIACLQEMQSVISSEVRVTRRVENNASIYHLMRMKIGTKIVINFPDDPLEYEAIILGIGEMSPARICVGNVGIKVLYKVRNREDYWSECTINHQQVVNVGYVQINVNKEQ